MTSFQTHEWLTISPVVSGTATMLCNIEVLRVVEVLIQAILDGIDDTRLQVDQKGARDVVLIVCLIEKHIFPVISLRRVLFKVTFRVDSVFLAETLPELVSNYIAVQLTSWDETYSDFRTVQPAV